MPRKSRKIIGEGFTHNMVQGINREFIFEKNQQKEKYLKLIKKYSQKYNVLMISYCIMDNHAHLIIYSKNIENISKFMKDVNMEYALYYNRIKERVGYVFRNRFNSKIIYSQKYLLSCIKYIHMNPVKAKIVNKEDEYKFSSYNDFINQKNFINSQILNLIFNSEENYLEKFKSIKYQEINLEKEKIEIEEILKQFLKENNLNISNKKISSNLIKKFIGYLITNKYNFSKKEIAESLNISRATLYRKIKSNY